MFFEGSAIGLGWASCLIGLAVKQGVEQRGSPRFWYQQLTSEQRYAGSVVSGMGQNLREIKVVGEGRFRPRVALLDGDNRVRPTVIRAARIDCLGTGAPHA